MKCLQNGEDRLAAHVLDGLAHHLARMVDRSLVRKTRIDVRGHNIGIVDISGEQVRRIDSRQGRVIGVLFVDDFPEALDHVVHVLVGLVAGIPGQDTVTGFPGNLANSLTRNWQPVLQKLPPGVITRVENAQLGDIAELGNGNDPVFATHLGSEIHVALNVDELQHEAVEASARILFRKALVLSDRVRGPVHAEGEEGLAVAQEPSRIGILHRSVPVLELAQPCDEGMALMRRECCRDVIITRGQRAQIEPHVRFVRVIPFCAPTLDDLVRYSLRM